MEKIYIGFSYHKTGILSKLIKLIENTPYSHVYIRRESRYGEYVYQASGLQVNFMGINVFNENNVTVEEYCFELNQEVRDKLLQFCIENAGKPYGMKALLQIGVVILLNRIGINYSPKGDENNTFICSELAYKCLKYIINLEFSDSKDFITPKQLHILLSSYGKTSNTP